MDTPLSAAALILSILPWFLGRWTQWQSGQICISSSPNSPWESQKTGVCAKHNSLRG